MLNNKRKCVIHEITTDKTLLISMRRFSGMLISNVHKSIIVMNSIKTRFSRNTPGKLEAHVLSGLTPLGCASLIISPATLEYVKKANAKPGIGALVMALVKLS